VALQRLMTAALQQSLRDSELLEPRQQGRIRGARRVFESQASSAIGCAESAGGCEAGDGLPVPPLLPPMLQASGLNNQL
jgi:hypothetical protein